MCLEIIFKGKEKKKELARFPDMVTCWKVCARQGNQYGSKYLATWFTYIFSKGWNLTKAEYSDWICYKPAFHAFATKAGARAWKGYSKHNIVKCRTEKKDIVAIGKQIGHLCIVTERIWIPKPKKKSA